jgi:hypothetical protein
MKAHVPGWREFDVARRRPAPGSGYQSTSGRTFRGLANVTNVRARVGATRRSRWLAASRWREYQLGIARTVDVAWIPLGLTRRP